MSDWLIGQAARISVDVKDFGGTLADPGALRLKVKPPTSELQTFVYGTDAALVKDAVGKYHVDLTLNASGAWAYRWECDAPNAGAIEGALQVRKSAVI